MSTRLMRPAIRWKRYLRRVAACRLTARRVSGTPIAGRLLKRRRAVKYGLWGGALLCLAGAAWIVVTALLARAELGAVQRSLETLRQVAHRGEGTPDAPQAGRQQARASLDSAALHAARARRLTSGPVWFLAAHVPYAGRPLRTICGLAEVSDLLAHEVLPVAMHAAESFGPGTSRRDLAEALSTLEHTAPALERAAAVVAQLRAETRALPRSTWLPVADRARGRVTWTLDQIAPAMSSAAVAARVLPPMLGTQEQRRYFVVFQNTAEARGTGGMPGAFTVLTVRQGKPRFDTFGTDTMLAGVEPTVDLGAEYTAQYGQMDPVGTWANSNVSPHFPNAARIWAQTWREYSGQGVDGVIAVDPSTLGRLLQATGPGQMPDGTKITADNVLDLAERTAYSRYADPDQRKTFLLDIARTAAGTLIASLGDSGRLPGLITAGYDIVRQERVRVWSARQNEQVLLEKYPLSGTLPDGNHPFAGLVINNAAGGKLDYYLQRELQWIPGRCTPTGRPVTARIRLTSRSPRSGLPLYVTYRNDAPPYLTQPGDNRLLVSYYASPHAGLEGVTVDGHAAKVHGGHERGHPVYTLDLELPAQSSRIIVFRLWEPVSDRPPVLLHQSLVSPLRAHVSPSPTCHS